VKNTVAIPVVGNGDIFQPEDAVLMINQTGCDGVMIGRGGMGNPWLFSRSLKLIQSGQLAPGPEFTDKIDTALKHLRMVAEFKGENRAVREMRKHIAWYLKGLRDSAKIREAVNRALTVKELEGILHEYRLLLEETMVPL